MTTPTNPRLCRRCALTPRSDDKAARPHLAKAREQRTRDGRGGTMTRKPCPGCLFAGCDRCEWQGGVPLISGALGVAHG